MYTFIAIIVGYLFGCVHGSQIIGNYKKINIKENGMKNAGATNATLLLGFKYGLLVAFIDILKAIISLLFISYLLIKFNVMYDAQVAILYINALFVIIGHNFPLTMNFKGGKGTASLFGVLLFFNWTFAVMSLFILLLFAIITNYFVTGTLMVYVTFVMYTAHTFGQIPALIATMFVILFFIKHRENFRRILQKEEVKVSTLLRREAS